ncbi:phosphorylase family protein [Zavarzinia sp. CC-PAN008]|uniref:phosphorylase family protein n=1 Tax=Zavarzinia sp. CC-PAN008 TaxID=3243332 RepID=UPI003F74647F
MTRHTIAPTQPSPILRTGEGSIGFVVGLAAEARRLAPHPLVAQAGGNTERAQAGARDLASQGATALVSFGLAGGLDPALKPGDLILATHILAPDGTPLPCDAALVARLHALLPQAKPGVILGSPTIVASAADKARLYQRHGALALDMESHGMATAAQALGLPFTALRAVCDPADRALPPAALTALTPEGEERPLAPVWAALRAPAQIPDLIALGRCSASAFKTLGGVARSLLQAGLLGGRR